MSRNCFALGVFVALLAPGCGPSLTPATLPTTSYQVRGKVVADSGKPLAGTVVHFDPLAIGYSGTGRADADGVFTIISGADKSGLPDGKYKVWFDAPPGIKLVNADADSSTLTVEIKPRANSLEPFKLAVAAPAPGKAGHPAPAQAARSQPTTNANPAASNQAAVKQSAPGALDND